MTTPQFKRIIKNHYRLNKRDMPWRHTRDPYKILVSEVMLQQTQVSRVGPFYKKFIKRFPDFKTLSKATTLEILHVWQGLGYHRRALALQRAAKEVFEKSNGRLPRARVALESLPGVGPGTAGALRAFAFNRPEVFIETNIRRVFIHFFFPRRKKVTDRELERYIKRTLDGKNPREWYWALMDYGAMLGAESSGGHKATNPNRRSAHYTRQTAFKGSDRELRGKILKTLIAKRKLSAKMLMQEIKEPARRVSKIVEGLCREGFIERKNGYFRIN